MSRPHCAAAKAASGAPLPSSTSLFADNDVGRAGMFHADDVIAGIDVMNLTRDAAREIAEEIHRGVADFLDRHAAPQRRIVLVPFENVAKVPIPDAASVLIGPEEMALTRMFFSPRSAAR